MTYIKWLLFWYVLQMVLLVHVCFSKATICLSYYRKWENIKVSLLCWYLSIVILSTIVTVGKIGPDTSTKIFLNDNSPSFMCRSCLSLPTDFDWFSSKRYKINVTLTGLLNSDLWAKPGFGNQNLGKIFQTSSHSEPSRYTRGGHWRIEVADEDVEDMPKFSAVVEDRFLCRHVGSNFIPTATIVDKTMVRK